VTQQLALFAVAEPIAREPARYAPASRGPRGLLNELIRQGLAEDALEAAAALCLLLDEEANGHS
jgi:hypothetical protein